MTQPRDEIELIILRTYRSVLRAPQIGATSSFFEFGGNSLLGIVLADRLSRHLKSKVTTAMLYRAPTPEQLASVVRDGKARAMSPLIPLHDPDETGWDPSPIVMMPGIAGDVSYAQAIMGLVGSREVFGVQTSLNPKSFPDLDWTVGALAARYRELLLKELPERPLILVGYSVGGCFALETSLLLAEKDSHPGSQVVLVAPPSFAGAPLALAEMLEDMLCFAFMADYPHVEARKHASGLAATEVPEELTRIICSEYVKNGWLPKDIAEATLARIVAQRLANIQAVEQYRPSHALNHEALLVLSSDEPEDPISDTPLEMALPHWRSLRVDGRHTQLFVEPWVQQVGSVLGRLFLPVPMP
jgi:thioesterase domain-containing protein